LHNTAEMRDARTQNQTSMADPNSGAAATVLLDFGRTVAPVSAPETVWHPDERLVCHVRPIEALGERRKPLFVDALVRLCISDEDFCKVDLHIALCCEALLSVASRQAKPVCSHTHKGLARSMCPPALMPSVNSHAACTQICIGAMRRGGRGGSTRQDGHTQSHSARRPQKHDWGICRGSATVVAAHLVTLRRRCCSEDGATAADGRAHRLHAQLVQCLLQHRRFLFHGRGRGKVRPLYDVWDGLKGCQDRKGRNIDILHAFRPSVGPA
jgi:hypothetical protein